MTADRKSLGAVFDAHTDAEFKTEDIEATMATMGDAPQRRTSGAPHGPELAVQHADAEGLNTARSEDGSMFAECSRRWGRGSCGQD